VATKTASPRRTELLEAAYAYALTHGLGDMSLRPLAAAIGSSPRVLLYLFGSKDGLIRELLARARADEIALLRDTPAGDTREAMLRIWAWLSDPEHRALLTLWTEAYARSLIEPDGPWSSFAAATVGDWLELLAAGQPASIRDTAEGAAQRTAALAVLRGALLDLLATGDRPRTTAAVEATAATMRR
jgi:AcrR family transcriptional regulator